MRLRDWVYPPLTKLVATTRFEASPYFEWLTARDEVPGMSRSDKLPESDYELVSDQPALNQIDRGLTNLIPMPTRLSSEVLNDGAPSTQAPITRRPPDLKGRVPVTAQTTNRSRP